ncbi:MAG: hypothetical protein ACYC0B_09475, partial [Gemmatimonadaceae bacterium]
HAHANEAGWARRVSLRRAAETLTELARGPAVDRHDVDWLRAELVERLRETERPGGSEAGRRRLRLALIDSERRMLVRLRNENAISDEVLRELELELDLAAIRAGGE